MRNSSQVSLLDGANSDDIAHMVDSGSALVFRRDAGAWAAEAQLRAANGTAGDLFGTSVARTEPVDAAGAIGPEGGLALCGSIFDAPEDLVKRGSATLFRRTRGAWTERATLVAADSAAGDECGAACRRCARGSVPSLRGGKRGDCAYDGNNPTLIVLDQRSGQAQVAPHRKAPTQRKTAVIG